MSNMDNESALDKSTGVAAFYVLKQTPFKKVWEQLVLFELLFNFI